MQYSALQTLVRTNGSNGNQTVTIPGELFRNLLICALKSKGEFDEAFYLAANPDLRNAIRKGVITSAAEHYYNTGYFECKMPKRFMVNDAYYLDRNPDVAKAISQRKVKNSQLHFDTNGYQEGRSPFEGFSLF